MAEVIEMGKDYGYESKSHARINVVEDEGEYVLISDLPVVKIDEWLSPDAERITKWIKLPSRNAKILISAMTNSEFKKMRNEAPVVKSKMPNGKIKVEKDEDWIQTRLIMDNILEPKITDSAILEYGLAGDITFLVIEISKLSGFDVDKAIRDALE